MIISSLIKSFISTLIIEYIILKLLFIKRKVFMPVLLVNMLTNPLIVYIYNIMSLFSFEYKDIVTLFLELLVVIVEGYIYKYLLEIKWEKALIISFISNAIAYLTGILLTLYL
jgi:hypothetical protein